MKSIELFYMQIVDNTTVVKRFRNYDRDTSMSGGPVGKDKGGLRASMLKGASRFQMPGSPAALVAAVNNCKSS